MRKEVCAALESVSKHKKRPESLPNPVPPVDEREFTDSIPKMVETDPTTLEEVKRIRREPTIYLSADFIPIPWPTSVKPSFCQFPCVGCSF
jgi:hypothetical protein